MDTDRTSGDVRRDMLILAVAGIVSLAMRLVFAWSMEHPRADDPLLYYSLARNLADGHGLTVGFITTYLTGPTSAVHPYSGFWMPASSILMALSMKLFGVSVGAAAVPGILCGMGLAAVGYFAAREVYPEDRRIATLAACLLLFMPGLFIPSILTESSIYHAFSVAASLLFLIRARRSIPEYAFAGLFAGFGMLFRQDGVFMLAVIAVAIAVDGRLRRDKVVAIAYAAAGLAAVLVPYWIWRAMIGQPIVSPGSWKTALFTSYLDVRSYGVEFTLGRYLSAGWSVILLSKLKALAIHVASVFSLLGNGRHGTGWALTAQVPFLQVFVLIGVVGILRGERERLRLFMIPALFLGVLVVFYAFVATFPGQGGSFIRSARAVVPFLVLPGVAALVRIVPRPWMLVGAAALCVSYFVVEDAVQVRQTRDATARWEMSMERLAGVLGAEGNADQQGTVMTVAPVPVNYFTGHPAIQMPSNGPDAVRDVARRFDAAYLLLPGYRDTDEHALMRTVPLTLVATIPGISPRDPPYRLYRFAGAPFARTMGEQE